MNVICTLLGIYMLILFARILLSWFSINPDGPVATFHGFTHLLTEPLLGPISRVLPPVRMGTMAIDLSPLIVIFALSILRGQLC